MSVAAQKALLTNLTAALDFMEAGETQETKKNLGCVVAPLALTREYLYADVLLLLLRKQGIITSPLVPPPPHAPMTQ